MTDVYDLNNATTIIIFMRHSHSKLTRTPRLPIVASIMTLGNFSRSMFFSALVRDYRFFRDFFYKQAREFQMSRICTGNFILSHATVLSIAEPMNAMKSFAASNSLLTRFLLKILLKFTQSITLVPSCTYIWCVEKSWYKKLRSSIRSVRTSLLLFCYQLFMRQTRAASIYYLLCTITELQAS